MNIFSYRGDNTLIKTERNEKLELIKRVVGGEKNCYIADITFPCY